MNLTLEEKVDVILEKIDIIEDKIDKLDELLNFGRDEFEEDSIGISFEPDDDLMEKVMARILENEDFVTKSGNVISVDFKKDSN